MVCPNGASPSPPLPSHWAANSSQCSPCSRFFLGQSGKEADTTSPTDLRENLHTSPSHLGWRASSAHLASSPWPKPQAWHRCGWPGLSMFFNLHSSKLQRSQRVDTVRPPQGKESMWQKTDASRQSVWDTAPHAFTPEAPPSTVISETNTSSYVYKGICDFS